MKKFSTSEVAAALGIDKSTLLRWLYAGKLKEPRRIIQPGMDSRLWLAKDVERARQYKDQNYRKGRGRKPRA